MNVQDFLATLHRRTESALAESSYSAMGDLLKSLHIGEADELAAIHLAHREEVTQFLKEHDGLSKSIKFVYERVISFVSSFDDMLDPTIMADMASLTALWLDEYPSAYKEDDIRTRVRILLESILRSCVERVAARVSPQIECLAAAIADVLSFLSQLHLQNARLVVLELPVGNSLPTKLLHRLLLANGYKSDVLRVSLSRNDKAKRGITRDALLENALGQVALRENDVLLYMDEWLTGTNFNRICTIVSRKLPSSSFFFPIGLLTDSSEHDKRYADQFSPAHDELLRRLGVEGRRFRFVFPPIQSRLQRFGYFFWSEHDRTAGYRKMQFLGSVFSTLDDAIEKMHADTETLLRAKYAFLKLAAASGSTEEGERISKSMVRNHEAFTELFNECYEDYRQRRGEIESIEAFSNVSEVEAAEAALEQVIEAILAITKGRKAQVCVNLAVALISDSTDIDPADRFYFPHHVPVIVDLEGDRRRLHDIWMELLATEIDRRLAKK